MSENLALKESLVMHWRDCEQFLADGLLNFGQCSKIYLMRKLKCTPDHAEKLISLYQEDKFLLDLQKHCEDRAKET